MKKLLLMLTFSLLLTGNVFANVSCNTDSMGTVRCTDGTSAHTDSMGNTTILSPNGDRTTCYTDSMGTTRCY